MKVLQLCLRVPFPARDGGTMAMVSLARGLVQAGAQLHMFALNTSKHFIDIAAIADQASEYNLEAHRIDNSINIGNTLANLFSGEAFHVSRFFDPKINERLKDLLSRESFDFVVFESIFMAPYLETVQKFSKSVCVLRSHNIEYRIWERVVEETGNPIKKAYLDLQKERLRKYEMAKTPQFDLVAAITSIDAEFYRREGLSSHVINLPFGIEPRHEVRSKPETEVLTIGFLGSMDWMPNQEGIRWFLSEIWPAIESEMPEIRCRIGGRYMPNDILGKAGGRLEIVSEVPDAQDFLNMLDLLVVPLRSGSGVRIKVLESMAYGIPVLSTAIGYEGINAVSGKSILEANAPVEFLASLKKLSHNRSLLKEIARSALDLVSIEHDPRSIAVKLIDEISQLKASAG